MNALRDAIVVEPTLQPVVDPVTWSELVGDERGRRRVSEVEWPFDVLQGSGDDFELA